MLNSILKVILIVLLLGLIAYGGITCYGNFFAGKFGGPPDSEKAAYAVTIKGTGNTFLTDDYEIKGQVHILHGYWEYDKDKYRYREHDLPLDEAIFGEIEARKR